MKDEHLLVAYDTSSKTYLYGDFMASFSDYHLARDIAGAYLSHSSVSVLIWLINGMPRYIVRLDTFGCPHCQIYKEEKL